MQIIAIVDGEEYYSVPETKQQEVGVEKLCAALEQTETAFTLRLADQSVLVVPPQALQRAVFIVRK